MLKTAVPNYIRNFEDILIFLNIALPEICNHQVILFSIKSSAEGLHLANKFSSTKLLPKFTYSKRLFADYLRAPVVSVNTHK